jgi:glucose-6-phosphate 1-epimerase
MDDFSRVDELNRRFGISGVAQVISGNGGLPKLRVTAKSASAEIYLHGAQITSWQPESAEEVFFLSEFSRWEDGRAIRGGVPVCFPWFGAKADDSKAPAHGFVRTREWRLDSVLSEAAGSVTVILSTDSDDSTRSWWPHEFRLVHRITIGSTLSLELTATNTGSAPFSFEEALHSYFRVGDAESVRVRGLNEFSYFDKVDQNREKTQSGDLILTGPTDNAYQNIQTVAELIDPILCRIVRTEKENSKGTVIWNPWQQGASALSDLGDNEWRHMACVEASNFGSSAVSLAPGEGHTMRATLSVVPISSEP